MATPWSQEQWLTLEKLVESLPDELDRLVSQFGNVQELKVVVDTFKVHILDYAMSGAAFEDGWAYEPTKADETPPTT